MTELIDVLNPDGTPAGMRKAKHLVHRDGDWHRSVHVWIVVPDGRLLLQKRSIRKESHPGLWDVSAAGHISAGETALATAIRETEEELGLRLAAEELRHLGTIRETWSLNGGTFLENEYLEIYLVRREVDVRALVLQPGEVDDAALVALADLDRYQRVEHVQDYELLLRALGPPIR